MMSVEESRAATIEAAVEAGERHNLPADDLRAFLSRYFRDVADEDLEAWDPSDVVGCGLRHHQLASRRRAGTANVRVYLPTVDEHGWSTGHTVVEIVNDDMPFLVDSVTAELSRQGRGIHLVIHPTFSVRRDDEGNLLEVLPSASAGADDADGSPPAPDGDRSRTSSRSPASSRRTARIGWMTRWIPRCCRDSSAVTESTRNGMSSLTISTTVWPVLQPCSSRVGR